LRFTVLGHGALDVDDLVALAYRQVHRLVRELVQLAHHHFTDAPRRDFALAQRKHVLGNGGDRLVDQRRRHRPLVQGAHEAGAQLVLGEFLADAVLLDHLRHAQLGGLVGGEALVALGAAAAPANAVPFLAHAGVDDLRIKRTAEGALHS